MLRRPDAAAAAHIGAVHGSDFVGPRKCRVRSRNACALCCTTACLVLLVLVLSRTGGPGLGSRVPRGPSSLLSSGTANSSSAGQAAGAAGNGTTPAAGAARPLTRLAFKRSATIEPFMMLICLLCDDPVSQQMQQARVVAPVTSVLLEHLWSVTPFHERVMLDVGAGIGYYTMLSAEWLADVVAFETRAWPRSVLVNNAALHKDGRVRLLPYGIGAVTTLKTKAERGGAGAALAVPAGGANGTSEPVPLVKLDDVVGDESDIALLRVGDQGPGLPGLVEVFEGSYGMLARVKYVLVSLDDVNAPDKRAVLTAVARRGGFDFTYNFCEVLPPGSGATYPPGAAQFLDVTDVVAGGHHGVPLVHETLLFLRHPLEQPLKIHVRKKLAFKDDKDEAAAAAGSGEKPAQAAAAGAQQSGAKPAERQAQQAAGDELLLPGGSEGGLAAAAA